MSMYRSRRSNHRYKPVPMDRQEAEACPFCVLDDRKVHKGGQYTMVIDNIHPYEFWDKHKVLEHLLLIPKRHVISLGELTEAEKVEYMSTMAEYEAAGYSVYWRNETNLTRTVHHQHTHLLKVDNDTLHMMLYLNKPYLSIWK